MKRPVLNWMYRMIGMVVSITLIYSCQAVTLRQAQNEWNNAVMLENSKAGEFDVIYPEVHYRNALEILDKVDSTGDKKLDISKDVLLALCYWQLAEFKKADDLVQILKIKAAEAESRDRLLIKLLPALIMIDEAERKIPIQYRRDKALQEEINQKVDIALNAITEALDDVASSELKFYVLESGLKAYYVRQKAHMKLGNRLEKAFDKKMKKTIKISYLKELPSEISDQWEDILAIK